MIFKEGTIFKKGSLIHFHIRFFLERQFYVLKRNGDIAMKVDGSISLAIPKIRLMPPK